MDLKELEKEAEEKAGIYFDSLDYDHGNVSDTPFSSYDVFVAYKKGALDFAEPREKRIAELEAEVKEWKDKADLWCKTANLKDHNIMINKKLEKHNEELIALINAERKRQEQCDDIHLRKIAELEAQIEKMKCCSNCDNWNWKHNKCEKRLKGDCFKHSKWVTRNF